MTSEVHRLKTIGLLGGMSWESSALYYEQINRHVRDALGGLYSAPIILDSVNFAKVEQWQRAGEWVLTADYLRQRAKALELAGADCIAIATNTMHKVYDEIAAAVNVPVMHIATPTIMALKHAGIQRAAFLGTRYSMEQDFLKNVYKQNGIELLVPAQSDRDNVHDIIFNELCQGTINSTSRTIYQRIINDLQIRGAQGLVLGCTEIALLISQDDVTLPVFDSTALHTRALADFTLGV